MRLLFTILLSLWVGMAKSQVLISEDFEHLAAPHEKSAGVKGNAFNLTETAKKRKPLSRRVLKAPYSGLFTASIWVKASPVDDQAYVILTNRTEKVDSTETIWELGKQAGGAWYWNAAYLKNKYEYRPTLLRQPINDGKWHNLVFTFDEEKREVRLYYDGKNVAIYFTPELRAMITQSSELSIGGQQGGELGEWETFNGMTDELHILDEVWNAEKVNKSYQSVAKQTLKKAPVTTLPEQLKVMNFNIWHGGNETGKYVGPSRIAEVIKASGADIISMQETYGSGARIADALGYYFYLRSSNLSIMSRYPISETIKGFKSFYNGGAHVDVGSGKSVLFITNWLNYPFDYWEKLEKNEAVDSASWILKQQEVNAATLKQILNAIKGDINNNLPVIFCGDLNTGSHLDWTESTRILNKGYVIPFPTSILLEETGFKDSYRELYPDPKKNRGITWSPQFPNAFKDRIDYIYYKGNGLVPVASEVIDTHKTGYPSDHGAVLTTFKINNLFR